MATEYFSVVATAGRTVYFRFFDPSDSTVFDFDDNVWEVNLAACTTPKLAAVEKTDLGDADESLYVASSNLTNMYNTATAKEFVVQAVDDLATDEVIATESFQILSGAITRNANTASIVAGAITAAAIADAAIDNATFAADVGSTAYATNIIALAADKALVQQKLDHLVAVADADDVVNDSIIAKLAATAGDWSTFAMGTDSLQAVRDEQVAIGTNVTWLVNVTEGDAKIEGTSPWTFTVYTKDTATVLVQKYLYEKGGTAIALETQVVGLQLETAT